MRVTDARPAVIACVAPPLVALAAVLSFSVLELFGHETLALPRPLNLAEAAGAARAPDVLRRLSAGEDPKTMAFVRPGLIFRAPVRVTAFEAAVLSRSLRIVAMVVRTPETLDGDTRRHLACLASAIKAADVKDWLSPSPLDCEPGDTRQALFERTSLR